MQIKITQQLILKHISGILSPAINTHIKMLRFAVGVEIMRESLTMVVCYNNVIENPLLVTETLHYSESLSRSALQRKKTFLSSPAVNFDHFTRTF